ncbi:MAG: nitroreductase family protein [Candidatus Pacebacteria bacterium]|jgi:nitroreductase|nr:nitroreductase family protein [Candidatus Paceibacterota bacterium]MBP9701315.1 nitroreductase family protein [Candidatus Paceibacterota bacterium]
MKIVNTRTTEYDINDIFLKRYSPRAMSGESISRNELMTLFEAARWAPSSRNEQPWRFLYAFKNTPDFELFFSFLTESNQLWCKQASVLIIGLSKKIGQDGNPNPKHSLDTGAAWENFALQGTNAGLVIHGMGGYHEEILRNELNLSNEYQIELMITVGKPGKIEELPEKLQEREKPSHRKNLEEIIFEGKEGVKKL